MVATSARIERRNHLERKMYMKIKHLLFFIPVTFLVACEGTDLIEPDNVSKEQISTQIIYNPTKYSKQKGDVFVKSSLPTTMAKQIPNACVTSIMEYTNI